jgi:hypothetical protein
MGGRLNRAGDADKERGQRQPSLGGGEVGGSGGEKRGEEL